MGGLPKAEKASFALVRFSKMRILAGIMADIHDLLTPWPALLPAPGLRLNPPCNGGKASKPKAPPPAPAPVRADSNAGEQAQVAASRREGLRKTINPDNPLAPAPALGTIGKLGQGGEGIMVNTVSTAPTGIGMFPKLKGKLARNAVAMTQTRG